MCVAVRNLGVHVHVQLLQRVNLLNFLDRAGAGPGAGYALRHVPGCQSFIVVVRGLSWKNLSVCRIDAAQPTRVIIAAVTGTNVSSVVAFLSWKNRASDASPTPHTRLSLR